MQAAAPDLAADQANARTIRAEVIPAAIRKSGLG